MSLQGSFKCSGWLNTVWCYLSQCQWRGGWKCCSVFIFVSLVTYFNSSENPSRLKLAGCVALMEISLEGARSARNVYRWDFFNRFVWGKISCDISMVFPLYSLRERQPLQRQRRSRRELWMLDGLPRWLTGSCWRLCTRSDHAATPFDSTLSSCRVLSTAFIS